MAEETTTTEVPETMPAPESPVETPSDETTVTEAPLEPMNEADEFAAWKAADAKNNPVLGVPPPEPVEETTDDGEGEPPPADEADKGEGEPPPEADPPGWDEAMTALRRNRVPKHVLDSTSKDELVEWGMQLKEQQANQDDFGKQMQQMREQLSQQQEGFNKSTDDTPAPIPTELKTVVDELGEEVARPIAEYVGKMQTENQAILGQMLRMHQTQACSVSRKALADDFPGLADDDKFDRVYQRMVEMSQSPAATDRYGQGFETRIEPLMRDAAQLEFGGDQLLAAKEQLTAQSNNHRKSQSQPATRKAPVTPMTRDEAEEKAFLLVEAGKTDEAKRMFTQWEQQQAALK